MSTVSVYVRSHAAVSGSWATKHNNKNHRSSRLDKVNMFRFSNLLFLDVVPIFWAALPGPAPPSLLKKEKMLPQAANFTNLCTELQSLTFTMQNTQSRKFRPIVCAPCHFSEVSGREKTAGQAIAVRARGCQCTAWHAESMVDFFVPALRGILPRRRASVFLKLKTIFMFVVRSFLCCSEPFDIS